MRAEREVHEALAANLAAKSKALAMDVVGIVAQPLEAVVAGPPLEDTGLGDNVELF
jgi:hypothetical protein